jgi:hypothetical protein
MKKIKQDTYSRISQNPTGNIQSIITGSATLVPFSRVCRICLSRRLEGPNKNHTILFPPQLACSRKKSLQTIPNIKWMKKYQGSIPSTFLSLDSKKMTLAFKSLNALESLNLEIPEIIISENELAMMSRVFSSIKSLKAITLHVDRNTTITDGVLLNFLNWIMKLPCLRSLNIKLRFRHYENLQKFVLKLKRLNNLQSLTVEFPNENSGFSDVNLNAFSSAFSSLISLRALNIRLPSNRLMTDADITELCISIKMLSLFNLEDLKLDFQRCSKISDHGLEEIVSCLNSLKSIDLNFGGCSISDKGMDKLLCDGLKQPSIKEKLLLDFSFSQLKTQRVLEKLSSKFKDFGSLAVVKLKILALSKVSNEGLKNISINLKYLKNLKDFGLSFSPLAYGKQITDNGIADFILGVKLLKSLENFQLSLTNYSEISDKSLAILGGGLEMLPNLKKIELSFLLCHAITDEG